MSEEGIEKPIYEVVQLKDGTGYFVRVTWSDGYEMHVNDMADEAEARDWIERNGENWHEWASHRVRPRR